MLPAAVGVFTLFVVGFAIIPASLNYANWCLNSVTRRSSCRHHQRCYYFPMELSH